MFVSRDVLFQENTFPYKEKCDIHTDPTSDQTEVVDIRNSAYSPSSTFSNDNNVFFKGPSLLTILHNMLMRSIPQTGLDKAFTIKDLGPMRYFIGLEVARSSSGILLNQRKYIHDILQDLNMKDCTPAQTPLPKGLKLSIDEGDLMPEPEQFRRLIGKLLYLNLTRPDVSYSIQHLSQFMCQPRLPHMKATIHIVRYLKNTINTRLLYPSDSQLTLNAYADADWGQCTYFCKFLSGYCIFLGSSLISWKTKKQKTVSKSSAESEYRSMSYTTSEAVWVARLLQDLQINVPHPITLNCDNKAAQHIAQNPLFYERTKHLDIDCHYVREKVQEGFLATRHVSTNQQLADLMTKPLGIQQHHYLAECLGLTIVMQPSLWGDTKKIDDNLSSLPT